MTSILCVENSETIRKVVKDSVLDLGYEFYEAQNGDDLFNRIGDFKNPDLIIIDWNMPVMSGRETIIKLRELPKFKETNILAMIKIENKDQVMEAIDLGANYYVLKPFSINKFQQQIQNIITENAV